jgi:hypothetical protein
MYYNTLKYYHTISIDHTLVPGDVSGMPVILMQDNFNNTVKTAGGSKSPRSDGGDLRFFADAALSTPVPFDLITFTQNANPALSKIEVVVRKNVSSSVDTIIYVAWGDPTMTRLPNGDTYGQYNTYDTPFKLWCPMKDDPDTSHVKDRTINQLVGTKQGANNPLQILNAGVLNEAQAFVNANGSWIQFPAIATGTQFTVFCPFNYTGGAHGYQRIVSNKNVYSDTNGFEITLQNGNNQFINVLGSSATTLATSIFPDITTDGFENFAVRFNGTEPDVFYNATRNSYPGAIASVVNNSNAITIGDNAALNEANLDAYVDPVIIYVGALSDAQVQAMQNNQHTPASFTSSVGATANVGPLWSSDSFLSHKRRYTRG